MSGDGTEENLVKSLDELDFTGSALNTWEKILNVISHANSVQGGNSPVGTTLRSKLLATLEKAMGNLFLITLWREILCGYPSNDGSGVLNAFRIFANVLRTELPEWLSQDAHCATVMRALIGCISEPQFDTDDHALSSILLRLTDTYLWYFIVALSENENSILLTTRMASALEPMLALNMAKFSLKLAGVDLSQHSDSSNAVQMASVLIGAAHHQGASAREVVDALILANKAKNVPEAFIPKLCAVLASAVVSALPQESMPEVMEAVAGVWGDKAFVSRADTWKQTLFTSTLLAALQRSEPSYLHRTGTRGVSLDLLLSVGISSYLDVDNIHIRKHGMRLACAYATLMGEPLHFAELDAIALEEEGALARALQKRRDATRRGPSAAGEASGLRQAARGSGIVPEVPGHVSSSPRQGPATPVGYDSDSDSSQELQGYALGEGGGSARDVYDYKDRLLRTNYLRDCLQMLRCPESKPEARQQLQAALERLPVIMASDPPDASDLCLPLTKELLTVSNAYNIPDFDSLRAAAVQAVLLRNPHISVPFLTSSLLGSDLPLGLKLVVLEWLMAAAKALSNAPEDQPAAAESASAFTPQLGKTVVKRPGKLAQQTKRTRYFRNDFGPLSAMFFHPLIQLLGRVWTNTLNETSPVLSGAKFNLITELFDAQAALKGGTATSSPALSHLDGVDALLPSQCLVALCVFTQCAVNTTQQRVHALEVAKVAAAFRQASAVSLRRAALYALRLSMESYLPDSSARSERGRLQAAHGPMGVLCNISREDGLPAENGVDTGAAAVMSIMAQPVLVEVVDWAAMTWKEDADEVSRALKHEIVTMAVNGSAV